jgi:hypothetical protein
MDWIARVHGTNRCQWIPRRGCDNGSHRSNRSNGTDRTAGGCGANGLDGSHRYFSDWTDRTHGSNRSDGCGYDNRRHGSHGKQWVCWTYGSQGSDFFHRCDWKPGVHRINRSHGSNRFDRSRWANGCNGPDWSDRSDRLETHGSNRSNGRPRTCVCHGGCERSHGSYRRDGCNGIYGY